MLEGENITQGEPQFDFDLMDSSGGARTEQYYWADDKSLNASIRDQEFAVELRLTPPHGGVDDLSALPPRSLGSLKVGGTGTEVTGIVSPARSATLTACAETDVLLTTFNKKVRGTRLLVSDMSEPLVSEYGSELVSVIGCVNVLLDIFHLYGLRRPNDTGTKLDYPQKYWGAIDKTLIAFLHFIKSKGLNKGAFIKYMKYKICAFFSSWHNQDIPTNPGIDGDNPRYIFGGCIGQWMHIFRRQDPNQWDSFTLSILMSKKGMPRADAALCEQACLDTVAELTTERPSPPRVVYELPGESDFGFNNHVSVESVEQIKYELRRTTVELFAGYKFGVEDMSKPVFPSTSSNYNMSRRQGGCVSELLEDIAPWARLQIEDEELLMTDTEWAILRKKYTGQYGEAGRKEQEELNKKYNESCPYCMDYDDELVIANSLDDTEFMKCWRKLYWAAFACAGEELPLVEPVALPEALKIRVITKGPPLTYFVLKTFQQFGWKVLKNNSIFALIGRPCTVEDMEAVCSEMGWFIISGDYVSSTNRLHSWVSEEILNTMAWVLDLPYQLVALMLRALTKHIFFDVVSQGWKMQKTGQLMGSIISFIFLCIANGALCRSALEKADQCEYRIIDCFKKSEYDTFYGTRTSMKSKLAPMRINGDDCALASKNRKLRYIWEAKTALAGLESSMGKTYFRGKDGERPFVVINSEHYDWIEGTWVKRLYVNMGLVMGLKRSTSSDGAGDQELVSQLGAKHHQLKDTCPPDLWVAVNQMFHYYNGNQLKSYDGPWYLPTWLGGLGLVPREDTFDADTLRAAAYMKILIATKDKLAPRAWPKDKEWYMHDLVADRYKELFTTLPMCGEVRYEEIRPLSCHKQQEFKGSGKVAQKEFVSMKEANDYTYKIVTCELLFRAKINDLQRKGKNGKLKGFRTPQEEEKRVMRHNSIAWKSSMKKAWNYPGLIPMDPADFDFQPEAGMLPIIL